VASSGPRCAEHAAEAERSRGTTTQRGYGAEHAKTRAALLSRQRALWKSGRYENCWRCGLPLLPGQDMAADHSTVKASSGGRADVLTHAACNSGKRGE
jgi:hypothetical protein